MTLLLFLPFGLLIGMVARMLSLRTERGGWIPSMLVGAAGGALGGWAGRCLGLSGASDPEGFIASILGATVLVIAFHATLWRSRARAFHMSPRAAP